MGRRSGGSVKDSVRSRESRSPKRRSSRSHSPRRRSSRRDGSRARGNDRRRGRSSDERYEWKRSRSRRGRSSDEREGRKRSRSRPSKLADGDADGEVDGAEEYMVLHHGVMKRKTRRRKRGEEASEPAAQAEPAATQADRKAQEQVKSSSDTKADARADAKAAVPNVFEKVEVRKPAVQNVFEKADGKAAGPKISFTVAPKVSVPQAASSSQSSGVELAGAVSGAVASALANLQATAMCQVAATQKMFDATPAESQRQQRQQTKVPSRVESKKQPSAEELEALYDKYEPNIPKKLESLYRPATEVSAPAVVGLGGVGSLAGAPPTIVGDYYSLDAMTQKQIMQAQQVAPQSLADNLYGQKIHMCKFFLQGHCKNKVVCNYAHNEAEMMQARRLYIQRNGPTEFKRHY